MYAGMAEIETIGQAWNAGWQISARCVHGKVDNGQSARKCDWKYGLDLMTLVATRGRDFPLARVAERLRCPRCGCRDISVLYHVPAIGPRESATSTTAGARTRAAAGK